jgi:hypothetical protein
MKNQVMKKRASRWTAHGMSVLAAAAGLGGLTQALARDPPPPPAHFSGLINDYVPATVSGGPWEVRGKWSLDLQENRGTATATFSAALTMETPGGSNSHTHHISMRGATVTPGSSGCPSYSPAPPTDGFMISGPATVTANGVQAPFAPDGQTSQLTVCVLGGSQVEFANLTLALQAPASGHFGTQAIHGVVVKCGWWRELESIDCAVAK